eukprot:CAMPEP_0115198888 /NCGR_PEP_ID=MMETSP0270-20121206/16334_1 /TAXON_ID=71861 /ORGANISM="Scrippsiella trochoidea, Strain CCMP3099" /LENGTH=974 /DNA_ID=CAMNT_0002612267 /DNA_START=25 /DNA_END=2949 /DNA_ORIENTATION=-
MCIPLGETRHIEQYSVFVVTGVFSLFAYLWLAFILVVRSPDVVEVWEAVATLLYLPVLIGVSYLADIGKLDCGARFFLGFEAREAEEDTLDEVEFTVDPSNEDVLAIAPPKKADDATGTHAAAIASADGDTSLESDQALHPPPAPPVVMKSCLSSSGPGVRRQISTGSDETHMSCEREPPKKMLSILEDDLAVGSEDAVTIGVPCLHARLSEQRDQDPQHQRYSFRSYSGEAKKRDSLKKKSFSRGFSLHSVSSDAAFEDAPAPGSQRRKSIAAHHHLAINRLRKSTNAAGERGSYLFEEKDMRLDPKVSAVVTVQLLIDRMSVSANLLSKTVKLVRDGALSAELRVEYSVDHCIKPTDRLSITKVAVGKNPQGSVAIDEDPVEWLDHLDTEEVTTRFLIIPADVAEAQIVVDNPGAAQRQSCNDFVVSLLGVDVGEAMEGPDVSASLGRIKSTYVICESEPHAGMLSFPCESLAVPASPEEQRIEVVVIRQGGCLGTMSCEYYTEALSAVADKDYVETCGSLTFQEGVTEMIVELRIRAKSPSRVARDFLLVLKGQEDDDTARFDPTDDGGEDSAILTITIGELKADSNSIVRQLDILLNLNHWVVGFGDWKGQFRSAVLCNGSLEAQAEATLTDWLFHVVSLPWMLFFSLIPPTSFCGGWICFYTCLLFIAACTAVIADLAELFGCVMQVPDIVTAITFVALGTSMPDLFASKVAATEDPTANSVNVFLGLGLPWTIAAIFWNTRTRDEDWVRRYQDVASRYEGSNCVFAVPASNLGFSIVCFCCASLGAISLLIARRRLVHGELGGPRSAKVATSVVLVCYWAGYVVTVSWRALRYEDASSSEELGVVVGIFLIEILLSTAPFYFYFRAARQEAAAQEVANGHDHDAASRTPDPPREHSDASTAAPPSDSAATVAANAEVGLRDVAAERDVSGDRHADDDGPGEMPTIPFEPEASRAQENVPRQMLESGRR